MKTVLITGFIFMTIICNAQYRINKTKYDFHSYSYQMGDPYNPSVMALSSVIIPGFGQIIEGENSRGLTFLGVSLSMSIIKTLVVRNYHYTLTFRDVFRQSNRVGQIGLRVWSAIDAVRVAKINNLAFRAKYNSNVSLQILPYPDIVDPCGSILTTPAGLTIIVSF